MWLGILIGWDKPIFELGVMPFLLEEIFKIALLTVFSSLIVSVSFIYILGLLWLGYLIGWDKPIFKLGAAPFLLAELFKIILLTLIFPWIIKLRKFI